MDLVDLMEEKFELKIEEWFLETRCQKSILKIKIINNSKKTFGSFKEIFEDKPKTPLPSVNLANASEIAVS